MTPDRKTLQRPEVTSRSDRTGVETTSGRWRALRFYLLWSVALVLVGSAFLDLPEALDNLLTGFALAFAIWMWARWGLR